MHYAPEPPTIRQTASRFSCHAYHAVHDLARLVRLLGTATFRLLGAHLNLFVCIALMVVVQIGSDVSPWIRLVDLAIAALNLAIWASSSARRKGCLAS